MKKFVLRFLALVLVLCMVVPCTPVLAYAEMTRPEGMTDEEWERLRQQQLAELAEKQAVTPPSASENLTQTDSLSKSEEGNLVVTDKAEDKTPVDETVPDAAQKQTVSVELPAPVNKEHIIDKDGKDDTYEYDTTIKVGDTTEKISVEESYDLDAKITEVETEGTGDKNVTDITYDISLNGAVSAEDAKGDEVIESTVVKNVDIADNKAVEKINEEAKEAEELPAPQYKVEMTVNGMDSDKITRVEHKYKNTDGKDEVEYYYNADNGIDETDTSKKYFTVVDKVIEGVTTVKEKAVSLWTGFLGIFHITTDAFEDTADKNGKKDTYASLEEAQPNLGEGAPVRSVEMLRDYNTDSTANLGIPGGMELEVDLNGHNYTNTGENAAIQVSEYGNKITIQNGNIISNGDGIQVSGGSNNFSLWDLFVHSNADEDQDGSDAAVKIDGSGNTVVIKDSFVDGTGSNYGLQDRNTDKNTVSITDSIIGGKTGVGLKNTAATIKGSYLFGTTGAAVDVANNSTTSVVEITSGWFESGKSAANIQSDAGSVKTITIKGGRFTKSTDLYDYAASGYAVISHNDGSYFLYEVVDTDYKPTRDGYYFKGYRDAMGNTISLKEASKKRIIAYAWWQAIPETTDEQVPLITVKTDEKGCTTKVTFKGDTAFVTVKDAKGEFAPISEVVITSIKRLQNRKIDTVEIQVDEDVKLVLDIEKAKLNGFTDIVEVMLQKDMLLITSGQDTCIELDIGELKEADKPVTIQLVEGELTIMLGKSSSMTVDLTKALKTKERIVVRLENGVLKLYDKYHKPIKD